MDEIMISAVNLQTDCEKTTANPRLQWPNSLGFDTIRYEHSPIKCPITGSFPAYAAGVIYRNGPGSRLIRNEAGSTIYELSHWFDAFAMLHRFEIHSPSDASSSVCTKVTYSSRSHTDELMRSIKKTGNFAGYTFAQKRDPCMSFFWKVAAMFQRTPVPDKNWNNVSITVSSNPVGAPSPWQSISREDGGPLKHSSGVPYLIARTDEGTLKTLDPETLEPVGVAHQRQLHPLLSGPLSASHAKSDPLTGDVYNYNLALGHRATYRVFRTSAATGETEILAEIAHPDIPPAYLHSFFLTDDYVILCVWGAHLAAGGLKVLWERNVLDALQPFDPEKKAFWFVVDRKARRGVIKAFESKGFFCFHTINAWQEGKDVICDLIEYHNLDVLHAFYYDNIRPNGDGARSLSESFRKQVNPNYARYRLTNVQSKTEKDFQVLFGLREEAIKEQTMDPADAGDIPTINTEYLTKPTRYFYSLPNRGLSTFVDSLAKVDTLTKTSIFWKNEWGHSPSEAIFVADPDGTREDDGVLLSVVLDGPKETSYLLCLDARTMTELGRADLQGPLNFSFHGQHVRTGPNYKRPIDV